MRATVRPAQHGSSTTFETGLSLFWGAYHLTDKFGWATQGFHLASEIREFSVLTMHNSPAFNEVWLSFIQMNLIWIRYVKRNYSQKCVILVLSHLLYIPKQITNT